MKLEEDDDIEPVAIKPKTVPEKPHIPVNELISCTKQDIIKKKLINADPTTQKSTGPSSVQETTGSMTKKSSGVVGGAQNTNNAETDPSKQAGTFSPRNYLFRIEKNRKLFNVLNYSTKDCALCLSKKSLYESIIKKNLCKKNCSTNDSYNLKIINDIVYNEPTHIVSIFKDYLIFDDTSEFLKRFYEKYESSKRIKIQTIHQTKYSKVFPNYFHLELKECMFHNIRKKQKAIDKRNAELQEEPVSEEASQVFTKNFVQELDKTDSILGKTMRNAQNETNQSNTTLMQSYIKSQENIKRPNKGGANKNDNGNKHMGDMNLQELVEKFISKDSISFANVSQMPDTSISTINIERNEKPLQIAEEIHPEPEKMATSNSKLRSKSRNANYNEPTKASKPAPHKSKEIQIDTKIASARSSNNPHNNLAQHVTDFKSIPLIQTSRSKSTGKFLIVPEAKISHPQTSRQKPIQPSGEDSGSSPEKRLDRGKIADIQATVAQMLDKTKGREHMRRSKSGFTGTAEKIGFEKVHNEVQNRQRTTSIVKRIESKIDLKLRVTSQTPTTMSKPQSAGGSSTANKKEEGHSKSRPGFLTNRNSAITQRSSTASIGQTPITSMMSSGTLGTKKPERNDPVRHSCKGLALDIDSINKCLQKQKVAIQEVKTIKTVKSINQQKPTPCAEPKAVDLTKFRSDYLNSLKNNHSRPQAASVNPSDSGSLVKSVSNSKKPSIASAVAVEIQKLKPQEMNKKVAEILGMQKGHVRRKSGADYNGRIHVHPI